MSNYHYGIYTSTTPRVQSSAHMLDKNSALLSSHNPKLHQRSVTKSPEAVKRSPSKKSKKDSKVTLESDLKGLLSPMEDKKIDFYQSPTAKGAKKKSKMPRGNRKKSNSPSKDIFSSNLDGKKKSITQKHQIMTNNFESDSMLKHKANTMKSASMQQDMVNQPQAYEAEFANWLSKRVQSSKNNYSKTQKIHRSELITPKHAEEKWQNKTAHLQNIWPEANSLLKSESMSHRQSLDTPNGVKAVKKSLQNHLSTLAGQHESSSYKKEFSLFSGDAKEKSIAHQKVMTPKGSFAEVNGKINHKVSPRPEDGYLAVASPLGVHNQNVQGEKHGSDARGLGYSYNFESSKEKQKNNFFKSNVSSSKIDGSSIKFEHHTSHFSNEETEIPARLKSAKHSEPNGASDINSFMNQMIIAKAKRSSDPQLQGYASVPVSGENYVLSTRSAFGRHENRFNFHPNTEENENEQNAKRIHSNSQPNKEMFANTVEEDAKITNQIVSELMRRNNIKDIKFNPNAKFLLLRKQIQEKRSKQNFKSADWNSPDRNELYNENKEPQGRGFSPNQPRSHQQENSTNEKLCHILNQTKKVLATYKSKENTWEKEKKLLVAEINHLRSVIENI